MTSKQVSTKLAGLNFLLCMMIVALHADFSSVIDSENIKQIFSLLGTLGDAAMPVFFCMSAYWFWSSINNIENDFPNKIKKRIVSLVIPYFCFSALFIIFNTILYYSRFRTYSTYSLFDVPFSSTLKVFFMAKCDSAIWFIRPLIVLQLISPYMYILSKKNILYGWIICMCTFFYSGIAGVKYSSCLFWVPAFSLGVILSILPLKTEKNICSSSKKIYAFLCFLSYIALAFFSNIHREIYYYYRFVGAIFLAGGVLLLDCKNSKLCKTLKYLNKYSFFIFMMHFPIINIVKRIFYEKSDSIWIENGGIIIVYIMTIIVTVTMIMIFYEIIRIVTPKLFSILNGQRN